MARSLSELLALPKGSFPQLHKVVPPSEPIRIISATSKKRARAIHVSDAGKAVGYKTAMNAHYAQDFYEGDPEKVPGPSFDERWNGVCAFRPAPWAESIKPIIVKIPAKVGVYSYCVSCSRWLHRNETSHLPVTALACASDHWRTKMNHQIVLVDRHGNLLWRAPYSVLGMSW